MTTDRDQSQFGFPELPDPVTDEVIEAIKKTITRFASKAVEAEFPELMRAWFGWHQLRHGKSRNELKTRVGLLFKTARALEQALCLDPSLLPAVAAIAKTEPENRMFALEGQRYLDQFRTSSKLLADRMETALQTYFKPRRGRPRRCDKTHAACELAEIYHYLTEREPALGFRPSDLYPTSKERAGKDPGPYGPFYDFVSAVFTIAFEEAEKSEHQVRYAIKYFKDHDMETIGQPQSPFISILKVYAGLK